MTPLVCALMASRALLIEPVWNRNQMQLTKATLPPVLLIEPVWNRNSRSELHERSRFCAFNRTSMESKHFGSARHNRCFQGRF